MIRRRLRQFPSGCRSCCLWTVCFVLISTIVYFGHFRSHFGYNASFYLGSGSKTKIFPDFKSDRGNPPEKVEHPAENEIAHPSEGNPPPYSCRVPQIDPFDQSILPYVKHPRGVECKRVQPDLVFVDEKGRLRVNKTAVKEVEMTGDVSCWFQYFDRGDTDQEIIYEKKKRLEKPVRVKKPFVKVACDQGPNSTRIFVNILAVPAISSDLPDSTLQQLSPRDTDVNVFIFALESASSSMVYRHLPKTLDFLNRTGAIIFKNFLKVGENTLPNLAAILTGKRARKEQDDMPAELPDPEDGFYDQWPMIWKKFRQKGYETVFMEDSPHIGTFHYSGKGFKKKPVDGWYFPFWYAQRQQRSILSKSSSFCYGNQPSFKIFTDIFRGELTKAKAQNRRHFMFSLLNDLSHDYTSDLERADDTWFDMFQRLDSHRVLNRTILIVMGDHGPRFSDHRRTPVGFAEERLPFLAIRLPPFLYSRHPRLREILESNAASRLVSMFDLHETLLDVLNRDYDGAAPEGTSIRGRSLFGPLPSDRTCSQAGVPDRYCLCDGFVVMPNDHVAARPAAEAVLAEVNRQIKKYKHKCATWKIDKILYFLKIPWPGEVVGETKTYFVAFKGKPLNGKFEGVVVRNMIDGSLKFKEGTLERINAFGGYGSCISKSKLWKFCACKEYVTTHD